MLPKAYGAIRHHIIRLYDANTICIYQLMLQTALYIIISNSTRKHFASFSSTPSLRGFFLYACAQTIPTLWLSGIAPIDLCGFRLNTLNKSITIQVKPFETPNDTTYSFRISRHCSDGFFLNFIFPCRNRSISSQSIQISLNLLEFYQILKSKL